MGIHRIRTNALPLLLLGLLFCGLECVIAAPKKAPPEKPSGAAVALSNVSPAAWLVFASPGCDHCQWLKEKLIPRLKQRLPEDALPPVYVLNVDKTSSYKFLLKAENILADSAENFPAVVSGRNLLSGQQEIANWARGIQNTSQIDSHLPEALLNKKNASRVEAWPLSAWPPPEAKQQTNAVHETDTAGIEAYREAQVIYFHTPGCSACRRTAKRLNHVKKRFPNLQVVTVSTEKPRGRLLQMAVGKKLDVPMQKRFTTPMVVTGSETVYGQRLNEERLRQLFEESEPTPFWQTWDEEEAFADARQTASRVTQQLTWGAVLAGGLVDGVNPCAFAVILFLVSYLCLSGQRSRKLILAFGLSFAAGVFTCYFLIGLGLSQVLSLLEQWHGLVRGLIFTAGILCVVFAAGATADVVSGLRNGPQTMRFGLPKRIHLAIHTMVRNRVARPLFGVGAFVLGLLVSSFELVCTGQIYLPILVLINSAAGGTAGLGYLVMYNIAFILPLLAVVILAGAGIEADRFVSWGQRHAVLTRALTGAFLLCLGTGLVIYGLMHQP